MRKLIALLLLAVFGLPLASPLMAMTPGGDMRLAACCRKGGKHDCAGMAMQVASATRAWRAPRCVCPITATAVSSAQADFLPVTASLRLTAGALSEELLLRERVLANRQIATRSSSPRGPPPQV